MVSQFGGNYHHFDAAGGDSCYKQTEIAKRAFSLERG
jgi:hypothetical protein